jgi:dynein heavy chain
LKKDAITEVRSYAKPLPSVEKVLATVMTILGKDPSWASAKKEMSDPSFLNRLKSFKAEDMSTNV